VLKDGTITKVSAVKSREKYLLVLNDIVLVCKPVTKYKSEYESKILFCDISFHGVKVSSKMNFVL